MSFDEKLPSAQGCRGFALLIHSYSDVLGRIDLERASPALYDPHQHVMANMGTAMSARSLIDGASFEPDALKAIGHAFDEAWQDIAATFGDNPHDIEHARLKLANAVLSIADEDSRDVAVLKRAALQRMALDYRRRDDVSFAGEKLAKAKVPREKV